MSSSLPRAWRIILVGASILMLGSLSFAVPLRPLDRASVPVEIRRFAVKGEVHTIVWSNQPRRVLLAGDVVRLFDLRNGVMVRMYNDKVPGPTRMGMALSPDGNTLYTARVDTPLCSWDVASGKPTVLPTARAANHLVAATADGKTLVFQRQDGMLSVWDLVANKERGTLEPINNKRRPPLIALAIAPDGRRLFTGHRSGAFLWDLANPGPQALIGVQDNYECFGADCHPQGTMVAAVPWSFMVYDDKLHTSRQFGNKADIMKFTPDGKQVVACAAAQDGSLEVFRWPDFHLQWRYEGRFSGFGVSPDGATVVAMEKGGTLRWLTMPE